MKNFKLLLIIIFAICQNAVAEEQKPTNIVGKMVIAHDCSPAIGVSIVFYSQEESSQLLDAKYDNRSKTDLSSIKLRYSQQPKFWAVTDMNGRFKLTLPRGKYLCQISYIGAPEIWREIEVVDESADFGVVPIEQDKECKIYIL